MAIPFGKKLIKCFFQSRTSPNTTGTGGQAHEVCTENLVLDNQKHEELKSTDGNEL
ncbi:hypothetical protein [Gelidibacter mesophilus]|uniref:hypothetical protein n=1 Tax=Gelidibacter mesophilus TaxID=169050 RepID=UPI000413AE20|nr:hypothetical protein [Gelidibacter mesophilus]